MAGGTMLASLRSTEGAVGGAGVGLVPVKEVERGADGWTSSSLEVSFSTSRGWRTLMQTVAE